MKPCAWSLEFQTAGPAWTHSRWRLNDIAAIGWTTSWPCFRRSRTLRPTSLESSMARSLRTLWTGRPGRFRAHRNL